ncbi:MULTISPECIES: hypothetical protein [Streptomyces]|uniref:Uncharacterized protein n=2 Tax=Streptomyces TaxID=1883 RepID=A0A2N8P6X0_STRNR|nr:MULTISPECIES: hypothetical protein [Streptomyces]PNE36760.1 hypothetical protein AOB60_42925 [Streptomyces noursei]SHK97490.1 hypothetical protein SAMN05216268_102115 [Streptomyces yunnanensis]
MRKAAQFAGAAAIAALLLSGCGSSGASGKDATTPSKAPQDAPSTAGGGDGKAADPTAVEGAWKGGTPASPLVLVVAKGTVAFSNGHKSACMGKVEKMAGMTMAVLKCTDGDTTRTMGTLKPGADGKTLTVNWKSGPTEKYTKTDDGSIKVPDMPKLPDMPKS